MNYLIEKKLAIRFSQFLTTLHVVSDGGLKIYVPTYTKYSEILFKPI